MKVEWLQIQHVRNLEGLQLTPGPEINLITGRNASGKTSILEAIYLLARARSFRTPRIQDVIRDNHRELHVSARILHENDGQVFTGIEKQHGMMSIRYRGEKVRTISEQARNIPIVLITQDSHNLVTGSAKQRRHWLDWAMFHVEHGYLDKWKQYVKALRHRNVLLKKQVKKRDLYRGWEEAMVESGGYLFHARERFVEQLTERLKEIMPPLFSEQVVIKQYQGWPVKKHLMEALNQGWEADLKAGYTRSGPHLADVKITSQEKEIVAFFSRGQIKLFVCMLMLAQARLIQRRTAVTPLVLVDDVYAELDIAASEYLLRFLLEEGVQSFLTTTESGLRAETGLEHKVFHVEQGRISP